VKKEFFQLIVRELFDSKYGMFRQDKATGTFWFSADSQDFDEFKVR
jgi:hypothetical protein